jgi:hypothetical protein
VSKSAGERWGARREADRGTFDRAPVPSPEREFHRDSDLFGEGARTAETQRLIQTAMGRGLQTREAEMELAGMLGEITQSM